jgi:hypothetical protein
MEHAASSYQVSAIRCAALAGFLVLASPLPGWADPVTAQPATADSGDPLKRVLHFLAPQADATTSYSHRTTAVVHAKPRSQGAPARLASNAPPPPPSHSRPAPAPSRSVETPPVYARAEPRPYRAYGYPPYGYRPYAYRGYGYAAVAYPGYAYRPYAYPYYAYRPYPVYRYAYRYPYAYGYPAY